MRNIPVFFINVILDSGKTTFIIDTIKTDGFFEQGTTLLIVCEQGEVEYDEKEMLEKYKTSIVYYENQDDFTDKSILENLKQYKPDRVVIEMNGMWNLKSIKFPKCLQILQFISFINGNTFEVYFNNMRQKFTDMISQSDIVCFINVEDETVISKYQTSLKLASSRAQFFFMNEKNIAKQAFEDPLPYDINADIIQIKNEDYGTFYIDTFDHKERYDGKNVEYDIMVVKGPKLPKGTFIAGRMIMNCCANDVQLCGFLCNNTLGKELKDRSWIHLKAKLVYEYSEEYKEEECVLYPLSIEPIKEIEDAVLNLSATN